MASLTTVQNILSDMAILLRSHGDGSWADTFERLSAEFPLDPVEVLSEVRKLYGGMGSLTDVVLYSADGSLPREENERFDVLRSELYQFCRETLTRDGSEC
jgi:uncharacterized protein DUF6966